MKTFKQYLKENVEQEENFRDVFANLGGDDWRNILKSFKSIIQNAFNYLNLEEMSEVHILDVSTYLMHKNHLAAIKYLRDRGYEPDHKGGKGESYQMYMNYLNKIKSLTVYGANFVFGQKVPNAYIPRPRITSTEEIEIKRIFKWLKQRNEKEDGEKIRSYWNSQFQLHMHK